MITRTAGLLLVCLAPCAFARADDAVTTQVKELEGEWKAVKVERDGRTSTSHEVTNHRMVFRGNEITIKSGDGTGGERRKIFSLDPGRSPKTIDIFSLDGQENGQIQACIYTLAKGRLSLCMPYAPDKDPGERPMEFKPRPGDGLMLITLERVKPK